MELEQAQKLQLPSINSIIVNKEFVGLGHRLEDRKRQRRVMDEESKGLESRVQYLERQNQLAEKQTQRKRAQLEEILSIRRRQDQDRQERERNQHIRQQQLQRNRRNSQLQRLEHRANLNQGLLGLYRTNLGQALAKKQDSKRWQSERRMKLSSDLSQRQVLNSLTQQMYSLINEQKQQGKLNVIDFRRERNRQFVQDYRRKMNHEEQIKLSKLKLMQSLQQKEYHLIEKLRKSSQVHDQLDSHIAKAHDIGLRQLQEVVLEKTTKPNSRSRSALSATTEDKLETVSSKQQVPQPLRNSRFDVESYRRKLSQVSHTIDVVDKPMMIEELIGIQEAINHKSKNKSKRKRKHRHKKRYDDD